SISTNMFAYDCQNPIEPTKTADGSIHRCNSEDLDELVDFMDWFHQEIGIDQKDRDGYRMDAKAFINTGNMFFWKDGQGNNVASCKFAPDGNMASINLVFTRPEFRRKHYAENLVCQVTKLAMSAGYVPMLYTDADYTASNACYEKIGYVLRGKLCTIA
ncbi:MAG: GNAT family N-acetyltransferase, partial [Clostridium sp.]|nr:GNAT family N-acetyltransferase [Clostridium sp.]